MRCSPGPAPRDLRISEPLSEKLDVSQRNMQKACDFCRLHMDIRIACTQVGALIASSTSVVAVRLSGKKSRQCYRFTCFARHTVITVIAAAAAVMVMLFSVFVLVLVFVDPVLVALVPVALVFSFFARSSLQVATCERRC
mmetsp:Transcript_588/g.1557  ORF Transcript_588/g.1557 Transcript_588/m.1557 type:complete len:140 (+) Transcript_588:210-629(+)